jgi:hypothetical protein
MAENPYEHAFDHSRHLLKSGFKMQIATAISAIGIIVGFATQIVVLGIVFTVLFVLCAGGWIYLILSGARESSRQVDRIVREAAAEQQRGADG